MIIMEFNNISNVIIFKNIDMSNDILNSIICSRYDIVSHTKVATADINNIVILLSFEKFFVNSPPHKSC